MALTISGSNRPRPGVSQMRPPVDPQAGDRIALFMRLVALNLEARQELVDAVRRLRKLEANLADPTLADHPRRPAAERRLPRRQEAERLAVQRIAELNASLVRQWDQISAADKHRYGLTYLIGEPDPDADIHLRLWCDVGLARLVPFPEDWTVPTDMAHRALDPSIEVREYSAEELLNALTAPF